MRTRDLVGLLLLPALLGCTSPAVTGTPASPTGGERPRLTDRHSCPEVDEDATCATLTVPLDHSGKVSGTIDLPVAMETEDIAPRGVLLLLTGGPGQPGVAFFRDLRDTLAPVLDEYTLVMLDQRGTGANALRCPKLQDARGGADLLRADPAAVRACARKIGDNRRFYTTRDTLRDLDTLRRALGAREWTLDGVSYGTFVAERYAIAYPNHVRRLVLDSVVPHAGAHPLNIANMRAAGRVLREVCESRDCPYTPARDVAWLVRHRDYGVGLLHTLVIISVVDHEFSRFGIIPALHEARTGNTDSLDGLIAGFRQAARSTPAEALSAGLHATTLCADTPMPWGDSSTPLAGRSQELHRTVVRTPRWRFWPFDRATAEGNGMVRECLNWTPAPPNPPAASRTLPDVPVLLLNGTRDLSTPLVWAVQEALRTPRGYLAVVPGAGHSVQNRAPSEVGRAAVYRFLTGEQPLPPCPRKARQQVGKLGGKPRPQAVARAVDRTGGAACSIETSALRG